MKNTFKPLRYTHHSNDPLCAGQSVQIGNYTDENIVLISPKTEDKNGFPQATGTASYLHVDDVASAVVALLTNTGFTQREPVDETDARLQGLAADFIDTFREAMVPNFRDEFRKAIDEAEDDWDAKCRVNEIIRRYEQLR